MWPVIAMMGISAMGKYMQNKAENEAGMADRALKEKHLKLAEDRAYEAYEYNVATIDSQEAINGLNIDKAASLAASNLKVSMAGSGIAGGMADDLDRQVQLEVAQDTVASDRKIRDARHENLQAKEEQLESIENERANLYKPVSDFSVSDALGVAAAGVGAYKGG